MKTLTARPILLLAAAATLLFALACSSSPTATPATAGPTATSAPVATATAVPTAVTSQTAVPTATPQQSTTPQYGGNLRYVGDVSPDTMDPNQSNQFIGRYIYYMIYNSLVKYAPDFSLLPELAKSWDVSADGKNVTLHLQQGVKFDDGSDFDANTVAWNFQYLSDPATQSKLKTDLSDIVSVEAVDKYTVVYHLKNPYRPLLSFLGERAGFMLNPAAVQKWGGGPNGKYGSHPSGTGAFIMSEWNIGSDFVVTKNPNYWEPGKPYLDKVTMINIPDATVSLAMIRTGEADIMDGMRYEDRKLVANNPDVNVVEFKSGRYYGIRISVDTAPWNNKDLRAAIAYSMDRQTIINTAWGGNGRVAYTPEAADWAAINEPIYAFDPAMAKQELTAAGYPNGITFNYWCTGETLDYASPLICQTIQAMLKATGINTNIVIVPASDYFTEQVKRETHFNMTSFAPRADPDGRLNRVFHTGGGSNINGYSNPQVDSLLDQAAQIYDISKAIPLYTQAQEIIAKDAGTIFLRYSNEYSAVRSNVQNFVYIPDLILRFRDIWLKQ